MPETCANCGTMIGDMEPAHVWRERVVCGACYGRLSPVVEYRHAAERVRRRAWRGAIAWTVAGAAVLVIAIAAIVLTRAKPVSGLSAQIPQSQTFQSLAEYSILAPLDPDSLKSASDISAAVRKPQKPINSWSPDNLVYQRQSEIASMLDSLHGIGVGTVGIRVENDMGVTFALNDGDAVLVLRTVCVSPKPPTETGRDRAAEAISQSAIPILIQMARTTTTAGTCDQVGVVIAYATDESGWTDEGVAICAPRRLCEDLDKGRITDQQFLNGATIFFNGAGTSGKSRRITITLK